jgi:D-arabinose 1-dehydrogenase-like Zn-dependent alcohol dehydrogenase
VEQQAGYRVHQWGGDVRWEEMSRGEPDPGEVEIEVEACGVGLTVLNCIAGNLADDPALLPRVPGHELVGRVRRLGPGADPDLAGRRVVAYFYLSCGSCLECVAGRDSRCRRLAGWVGVHRDGGYAPWTVLPARNVIPIPDDLDPVYATVVPDAVATPVHVCVTRAALTPADRVAVIGAGGGVGIHMVQVAALRGAEVAGLDIHDGKLETLEELGARPVRSDDFTTLDPAIWPQGPPTVVIDLIGSPASLRWSAEALDMGGRLVVLTTFPDRRADLDPRAMVFRETSVIASRYASRSEVALAGVLVASGRIRPVIGEVVGPDGVPSVHDQLRAGTLLGRGALRWDRNRRL